jgi:hypothetical protein
MPLAVYAAHDAGQVSHWATGNDNQAFACIPCTLTTLYVHPLARHSPTDARGPGCMQQSPLSPQDSHRAAQCVQAYLLVASATSLSREAVKPSVYAAFLSPVS